MMYQLRALAAWLLAPLFAWALPGDLVEAIKPQLRQPIREAQACLDAGGAVHLWANFHTLDGQETGGLIRLEDDGRTAAILAPELLPRADNQIAALNGGTLWQARLGCLEDGRFMVSASGTGGVLITPEGQASSGFFQGMPAGIRVSPQFERGGSLYFVITQADGARVLGRQAVTASVWSPEILPTTGWPLQPVAAVPGPGDQIRVLGSADSETFYSDSINQRVFLIDPAGQLIPDAAIFDPALNRPATLTATPGGGYRLVFAGDPTWWMYWPSSFTSNYRVEWRNDDNVLLRAMDFPTPGPWFVFAEESAGNVLATGPDGQLHRFSAAGDQDPTFASPGLVGSILPLPGGKWLLDGTRRILADGRDDPTWLPPDLESPANLTELVATPDGGFLAVGDFHRFDGAATSHLAKLTAAGRPFPGFVPDPRLGRISAIAVAPDNAVTLALTAAVTLADGRSSKLVRLRPGGALDETLFPPLPTPPGTTLQSPGSIPVAMACQADGGILILRQEYGGEVNRWTVARRLPDLTSDPSFNAIADFGTAPRRLLALDDGGFFAGSQLYRANGQPQTNLDPAGSFWSFSPLCLMPDGAVIFEQPGPTSVQLRRWKKTGWDESFVAAVASRTAGARLGACPGPAGKLYVWGDLGGDLPPATTIVRLHRNGRCDATFRAAALTHQDRRGAGPWLTHSPAGLVAFEPAANATASGPAAALWHPASDRLWLAGSFTNVATAARDGLAVLEGGNATGYPAWSQAALRSVPDRAEPAMDPDADGCPNQLEYATGADPLVPDPAACALQPIAGEPLRFRVWLNPEAPELAPIVKTSADLAAWHTATGAEVALDTFGNRLGVTLFPGAARRFVRIDFISP